MYTFVKCFNWFCLLKKLCLFIIQLWGIFWYKPFVKYMYYKYFPPSLWLAYSFFFVDEQFKIFLKPILQFFY